MTTPDDRSEGTTARITVRYWAAARAAAGLDAEEHSGATVGDVLVAAVDAHPALAPVVQVASVLLDGRPASRETPVADGMRLEVLPPFAGG
jgi:molybdopterin converting factor small subunit